MHTSTQSDVIVQEITIRAPAARVFDALTRPEERVTWWGAEGRFQATSMESDLRPGGQWSMRGRGPNGKTFLIRGEYRIVAPPTRLAFTWLPDWQEEPLETLVQFDLTESDGVTHVRLTHSGLTSDRARTSHRGWPDILAWLRAYAEAAA